MTVTLAKRNHGIFHMTKNLTNENQGFNDTLFLANRNQGIQIGGELQKQF